MSQNKWLFEFLPKDKVPSLSSAYGLLFLFGPLGFHHFYLDRKKNGYWLLILTAIQLVMLLTPLFPFLVKYGVTERFYYGICLMLALAIGCILIWDIFTLPSEIRKRNGINSLW